MNLQTYIAATRFGIGIKPGELETLSDGRAWLKQQLAAPTIPPSIQAMVNSKAAQAAFSGYLKPNPDGKPAAEKGAKKKNKAEPNAPAPEKTERNQDKKDARRAAHDLYLEQCAIRFTAQVQSKQPFIERLVMFWSNHFTVSAQKHPIVSLVNACEAEAVRPHVTGNFADMLIAVTRHPAMLIYLDNAQSIGPSTGAGTKKGKGLNENLAREILELHTLGAGGGYTQADVIALAKIITGWSIDRETGSYAYHAKMHEPGPKTLLGKTFADQGENEGLQALRMIAMHPSTAKHLATKLARHFIADDPPPAAVQKLADVYLRSGGNLTQVYTALIDMEEPWQAAQSKMKTPYEFALSTCRLTGVTFDARALQRGLQALNYTPFNASSPAGEADTAVAWVSPDSVMKRIEWAKVFAKNHPPATDPSTLAQQVFGPVLRKETAFIIKGAASPQDGLAFLLASPEFQRR